MKTDVLTFSRLGHFGRLGNQLWQIVSTLGIAKATDKSVSLPPWKYEKWFSFPNVFDGPRGQEISEIHGHYLQDLRFVKSVEREAHDWLKPSARAMEEIADLIEKYSPSACSAVHVRRGDYAEEWRGHGMLPAEWYLSHWPHEPVLVFSDDPEWCRQNLPGEVVHADDWMDLLLMSMCQRFTISNSSFAWWAAWSADKPVVAPAPWFPDREFNIYPQHWTKVSREVEICLEM